MEEPSSHLLRLPKEIRIEIYTCLLDEHIEPPSTPPTSGRRYSVLHDIQYPKHCRFRYPRLIWANRQLRGEVFDLVDKRAAAGPLTAKLDIIFKGYLSWPTWTYLPAFLPRDEPFNLDVDLRIFSTEAFRSNDGWPRQPGTAFRDLLWLLNSLLHNGPPFTSKSERGRDKMYRLNILTVNVSFHEQYTPATWPETAHNIFKMLKELALGGVTSQIIKTVRAHCEYVDRGESKLFDAQWDAPYEHDREKAQEWNEVGFFCPAQMYSRSLNSAHLAQS